MARSRVRFIEPGFKQTTKIPESIERHFLYLVRTLLERVVRSMELAWLANDAPAIANVVDKATRTKVPMTGVIDRELRRMTRSSPQAEPIEPFNFGPKRLFNGLMRPHAVYS